jgi:hypothetical protein
MEAGPALPAPRPLAEGGERAQEGQGAPLDKAVPAPPGLVGLALRQPGGKSAADLRDYAFTPSRAGLKARPISLKTMTRSAAPAMAEAM